MFNQRWIVFSPTSKKFFTPLEWLFSFYQSETPDNWKNEDKPVSISNDDSLTPSILSKKKIFKFWYQKSFLLTSWNGHDMTSKNCTQFKSNLNRLKIERSEEYYILLDIKICAGGILIISNIGLVHFTSRSQGLTILFFQILQFFNYPNPLSISFWWSV